ncbi:class I SAM-dependent methyltransferase [Flammeovirgaceae bacterium SG7u.111]|nr:class I SAM-dependent methyltransferase [Flammeovirgaceae bacterium SG7u.132]WPO35252.1 class I SAM-dependent methyltransferase [Flammeovirgaceae bacterium SG7u.111]
MSEVKNAEWFAKWFNSPYYHILYRHRDIGEAKLFIDNLSSYLEIQPNSRVLDIACGKGRHSLYLNEKGFRVDGIDLSEENIRFAQQFENEHLHFAQHDMRMPYKYNVFDFSLNLFTSFGYFSSKLEDLAVLSAARFGLKEEGKLVIDFFNTSKVVERLRPSEEVHIDGIDFQITREHSDGFIWKNITINDHKKEKEFFFQERVRAFSQEDFMGYFELTELECIDILGNYKLNSYDEGKSNRMIFILKPR